MRKKSIQVWIQKMLVVGAIISWNFLCIGQIHFSYQFSRSPQQTNPFNKDQMSMLEIFVADQLLQRADQVYALKWRTDFQKKQMTVDAEQALFLYAKVLGKIPNKEERSKVYFRMGYLHEMLSLRQKALSAYQQVLSLSQHFQRVKYAYQKVNKIKKKSLDVGNENSVSLTSLEKQKSKVVLETEKYLVQVQESLRSNQWQESVSFFEKACQKYAYSYPCTSENCSRFSSSIRYVVQEMRQKLVRERHWLSAFYKIYMSYFPRDLMVSLSAAQWFLRLKEYEKSMKFYQRYILFEKKFIHKNINSLSKQKENFRDLEPIFYFHQRIALLSQQEHLQIQSYDFYLSHSVTKQFVSRVMYLKNVAFFRLGEYERTAPLFRKIAMTPYKEQSIREQAAVYAIRSLLQMDQKTTAHKWIAQFSDMFPNKQADFKQLLHSDRFS